MDEWTIPRSGRPLFERHAFTSTAGDLIRYRNVTDVRVMPIFASATGGGPTRKTRSRWRLRSRALEQLEGRALLSVVGPIAFPQIDGSALDRGAIEVGSVAADRHDGHAATTAATSAADEQSGERTDGANVTSPSLAARSDGTTADESRASPSADGDGRDPTEPGLFAPRIKDPASPLLSAEDAPLPGSETAAAPTSAAAIELADVMAVLGSAPGAAATASSLGNQHSRFLGPDSRTGPGPGTTAASTLPPGSPGALGPESEVPGLPAEVATVGNQSLQRPDAAAENLGTTWGNLLEGALQPGWESVDAELRQFLSRVGELTTSPYGGNAGAPWTVFLGAAAALVVIRRASRTPRGLFRESLRAIGRPTCRRVVAVAPWPLGPP